MCSLNLVIDYFKHCFSSCRLELRYGEKFVTYALSFITCGHSGISEPELEDALSCSDEVLIEVKSFIL